MQWLLPLPSRRKLMYRREFVFRNLLLPPPPLSTLPLHLQGGGTPPQTTKTAELDYKPPLTRMIPLPPRTKRMSLLHLNRHQCLRPDTPLPPQLQHPLINLM